MHSCRPPGWLAVRGYGRAVDDVASAAAATVAVDQQHLCVLFQKVFLRGLDDVPGAARHPAVLPEERRQGRGEHEVGGAWNGQLEPLTVGAAGSGGATVSLLPCYWCG